MTGQAHESAEPAIHAEVASSRLMREILGASPIVPVVTLQRPEDAVPLAEALKAGGVSALEVTLRTPAGLPGIARIAKALPDIAVGAGTVLSLHGLVQARGAGARFSVSPGLDEEVLAAAEGAGHPFLPGIATPTEAMRVLAAGHRVAKLFPAAALGGTAFVDALAGPFPELFLCPTGGISAEAAPDFLARPAVLAVGGSFLASDAEIAAGAWSAIVDRTAALVEKARAARGATG